MGKNIHYSIGRPSCAPPENNTFIVHLATIFMRKFTPRSFLNSIPGGSKIGIGIKRVSYFKPAIVTHFSPSSQLLF
jgi:hypothetical protein